MTDAQPNNLDNLKDTIAGAIKFWQYTHQTNKYPRAIVLDTDNFHLLMRKAPITDIAITERFPRYLGTPLYEVLTKDTVVTCV